jgi:hypothetical protein
MDQMEDIKKISKETDISDISDMDNTDDTINKKCALCWGPVSIERPDGYQIAIAFDIPTNQFIYAPHIRFCKPGCIMQIIHSRRSYNPHVLASLNSDMFRQIYNITDPIVPSSDPDLLADVRQENGLSLEEYHNLSNSGYRIRMSYSTLRVGSFQDLMDLKSKSNHFGPFHRGGGGGGNHNQDEKTSSEFILPSFLSPLSGPTTEPIPIKCPLCRHTFNGSGIPIVIGWLPDKKKFIRLETLTCCSPECLFTEAQINTQYNTHEITPLITRMMLQIYGISKPIRASPDPNRLIDVCLDSSIALTIDQFRQGSHQGLEPLSSLGNMDSFFETVSLRCVKQYVLRSSLSSSLSLQNKNNVVRKNGERKSVVYHLSSQIPLDEHKQSDPCTLIPNHIPLFPPSVTDTWSSIQRATQPSRYSVGENPSQESVLMSFLK